MESNKYSASLSANIVTYGNPVLRTKCANLEDQNEESELLLDTLWATMQKSGGLGLAAPQINAPLKAFVVDSKGFFESLSPSKRREYFPEDEGIQESFINARIVASSEDTGIEYEACLSIPGISELTERKNRVTMEYYDASWISRRKQFSGFTARIIQHEFDHTCGILYIDYLPKLKKKMLSSKLRKIKAGHLTNL